jgi:glycosyltransferase involved in cell wall biosynthesis
LSAKPGKSFFNGYLQEDPMPAVNKVSVIVPLFNEAPNVPDIIDQTLIVLKSLNLAFEMILIDDGSTDNTFEVLRELAITRPALKIIQFRRNFGQTAAMAAGFDHAAGDVIIPMDGDLQNDPSDIPQLLDKINQGYDVVSGWRKNRKDKLFSRKIPSWTANYLIGKITGVLLHDYGCTLKAYRREIVENFKLYGEMHRFLPALASWTGARVAEIEVRHNPRRRGKSKYGLTRTFKVLLDLMTVKFLGDFSTKPLHIFGGIGLLSFSGALISGCAVLYQKFLSDNPLNMNKNPLLTLTALLIMMAIQFLLMGLLAEMQARIWHESRNKPAYVIRQIIQSAP